MALARVITEHPHAVQRELLIHHFRWGDFGRSGDIPLELWEFVSFILGAPPTSGVGLALSDGWTPTDHLLANMQEQDAGLIQLTSRYTRPGVKQPADQNSESFEPGQRQPQPWGGASQQDETPMSSDQVKAAVMMGGQFDRFDSPADFEAQRAKFYGARYVKKEDK